MFRLSLLSPLIVLPKSTKAVALLGTTDGNTRLEPSADQASPRWDLEKPHEQPRNDALLLDCGRAQVQYGENKIADAGSGTERPYSRFRRHLGLNENDQQHQTLISNEQNALSRHQNDLDRNFDSPFPLDGPHHDHDSKPSEVFDQENSDSIADDVKADDSKHPATISQHALPESKPVLIGVGYSTVDYLDTKGSIGPSANPTEVREVVIGFKPDALLWSTSGADDTNTIGSDFPSFEPFFVPSSFPSILDWKYSEKPTANKSPVPTVFSAVPTESTKLERSPPLAQAGFSLELPAVKDPFDLSSSKTSFQDTTPPRTKLRLIDWEDEQKPMANEVIITVPTSTISSIPTFGGFETRPLSSLPLETPKKNAIVPEVDAMPDFIENPTPVPTFGGFMTRPSRSAEADAMRDFTENPTSVPTFGGFMTRPSRSAEADAMRDFTENPTSVPTFDGFMTRPSRPAEAETRPDFAKNPTSVPTFDGFMTRPSRPTSMEAPTKHQTSAKSDESELRSGIPTSVPTFESFMTKSPRYSWVISPSRKSEKPENTPATKYKNNLKLSPSNVPTFGGFTTRPPFSSDSTQIPSFRNDFFTRPPDPAPVRWPSPSTAFLTKPSFGPANKHSSTDSKSYGKDLSPFPAPSLDTPRTEIGPVGSDSYEVEIDSSIDVTPTIFPSSFSSYAHSYVPPTASTDGTSSSTAATNRDDTSVVSPESLFSRLRIAFLVVIVTVSGMLLFCLIWFLLRPPRNRLQDSQGGSDGMTGIEDDTSTGTVEIDDGHMRAKQDSWKKVGRPTKKRYRSRYGAPLAQIVEELDNEVVDIPQNINYTSRTPMSCPSDEGKSLSP